MSSVVQVKLELPKFEGNRRERRQFSKYARRFERRRATMEKRGTVKCTVCKKKLVRHADRKFCPVMLNIEGVLVKATGDPEHQSRVIAATYQLLERST